MFGYEGADGGDMINGARCVLLVSVILAGVFGTPAAAVPTDASSAQYIYEALLDTDNNPNTGGPVKVVQGTETPHDEVGIDYIVRVGAGAVVPPLTTGDVAPIISGPEVFNRDVLKWHATTQTFDLVDCNHTMYPLGVGSNGEGLVEFGAPLQLIGNPSGTIRGVFHAQQQGVLDNDYTAPFFVFFPVQAPAQSHRGLAVLGLLLLLTAVYLLRKRRRATIVGALMASILTVAALAWAAGIILDGNFADWTGIVPVVTDPSGDSSIHDPAEDILAGYAVVQQGNIFFRMDLAGQIQPPN